LLAGALDSSANSAFLKRKQFAMKPLLGRSAVLLFSALAATAHSKEPWPCPSLPADSGLEWVRHNGPDFIVCYAMEAGGKKQAFGIYLGNHPSFDPSKGTVVMAGNVAGREVVWFRGPDDRDKKLSLQTVTSGSDRRPYATKAQVWTGADDEPTLRRRLEILQRLDFSD
jgi:hypothetical protein